MRNCPPCPEQATCAYRLSTAIIQTALLSLGAFGLYLAKLPPGSAVGPAAPQITASGALVMAPAIINLDVSGRALVIATSIGQILFSTPDGTSGLRHIYNRRTDSPNWPDDFIQHEKIEVNVKNKVLLDKLRDIESGKWMKVYENGTLSDGTRVSLHYFRSSSGKVFDVELHFGWSSR